MLLFPWKINTYPQFLSLFCLFLLLLSIHALAVFLLVAACVSFCPIVCFSFPSCCTPPSANQRILSVSVFYPCRDTKKTIPHSVIHFILGSHIRLIVSTIFFASRVTRRVGDKSAQSVARPILENQNL
jgi:hypothetical protein